MKYEHNSKTQITNPRISIPYPPSTKSLLKIEGMDFKIHEISSWSKNFPYPPSTKFCYQKEENSQISTQRSENSRTQKKKSKNFCSPASKALNSIIKIKRCPNRYTKKEKKNPEKKIQEFQETRTYHP